VRRNVCGIAQVRPHASKAARTAPALLLWSHARSGSRWAGAAKTYPSAPSSAARAASCSTSQSGRFSYRSDVSLLVPRR
jgi:hypothetical protein